MSRRLSFFHVGWKMDGAEAVLFIGRRRNGEKVEIPSKVAEEFLAPVQWKNFPDEGHLLTKLVNTTHCVIDIDTLRREDKALKSLANIDEGRAFWIYSRRSNTMLMLDGVNGLMILNPPSGK